MTICTIQHCACMYVSVNLSCVLLLLRCLRQVFYIYYGLFFQYCSSIRRENRNGFKNIRFIEPIDLKLLSIGLNIFSCLRLIVSAHTTKNIVFIVGHCTRPAETQDL